MDGKQLQSYKGYCPVQMIWQHPEQAVNPRLRMRAVFEEGDQVDPAEILYCKGTWKENPVSVGGRDQYYAGPHYSEPDLAFSDRRNPETGNWNDRCQS